MLSLLSLDELIFVAYSLWSSSFSSSEIRGSFAFTHLLLIPLLSTFLQVIDNGLPNLQVLLLP